MRPVYGIDYLYQKFCAADGNQHIASEYAIRKIQQLVQEFKITNVLEVCLGIGSIAGSLMVLNPEIKYTGTEENAFCLNALSLNLGENHKRLKIYSGIDHLATDKKYQLLIIDGKDPNLFLIKKLVPKNAIVVIEGDRLPQQDILLKMFPDLKFVHCISTRKNKEYSPSPPDSWQGGVKVLFIQPNLNQKIWWLKEKFFTKLKYWKRGIL